MKKINKLTAYLSSYKIASPEEAAVYRDDYTMIGDYNWFNNHRFAVASRYLPSSAQTLLDFGCGNGLFLDYLNFSGHSLSAVGYEPYLLSNANRSSPIYESLEHLGKQQFDVVTALDVIEHIEDDEGTLMNINNLIKAGGTLILIVPGHEWLYSLHDSESGHYRRYTKTSVEKVLEKSGFSVVYQEYFFFFLIPVSVFIKYYLLCKKILGKKLHIRDLPSDPLRTFSCLTVLEKKCMQHGIRMPCGHSLLVNARKDG